MLLKASCPCSTGYTSLELAVLVTGNAGGPLRPSASGPTSEAFWTPISQCRRFHATSPQPNTQGSADNAFPGSLPSPRKLRGGQAGHTLKSSC